MILQEDRGLQIFLGVNKVQDFFFFYYWINIFFFSPLKKKILYPSNVWFLILSQVWWKAYTKLYKQRVFINHSKYDTFWSTVNMKWNLLISCWTPRRLLQQTRWNFDLVHCVLSDSPCTFTIGNNCELFWFFANKE